MRPLKLFVFFFAANTEDEDEEDEEEEEVVLSPESFRIGGDKDAEGLNTLLT